MWNEEDHFEDVEQRVLILFNNVCNLLKDAEDEYDKKSKSSGRRSKNRSSKESTRSSRTSKTSSSRSSEADSLKSKVSSKARAIGGKGDDRWITDRSIIHREIEDDRNGSWKTANSRKGGESPSKSQNLRRP